MNPEITRVDLTVAIPTFNGAERLPQLLARLRSQINTELINWEILIVDNNSTDHTAAIVQEYQAQPFQPLLKYCFEPRQGAAFARLTAMQVAQGEFVGFIDDDNWPDPHWVAAAYAFGQAHPQVGAYGGQIHGAYEVAPPPDVKRIQTFLAIRERGEQAHPYCAERLNLPPAAALVVRRAAWLAAVPPQPLLAGRQPGGRLIQGDDYEPLMYLHKAGWEIWYNPAMHTEHQIPARRLEQAYLLELIRGSCLCICQLRVIPAAPLQKPWIVLKVFLGSLKRAIAHWIKYRGQWHADRMAACEMAFYWSSSMSSFYYLKTVFVKWGGAA